MRDYVERRIEIGSGLKTHFRVTVYLPHKEGDRTYCAFDQEVGATRRDLPAKEDDIVVLSGKDLLACAALVREVEAKALGVEAEKTVEAVS